MIKNLPVYVLILTFITSGCQENEFSAGVVIQNKWYNESEVSPGSYLVYRNEIVFQSNGIFERSLKIVNRDTQEELGYLSLFLGEYEIVGDILKQFNVEHYGLDNESEYMNREDLMLENTTDEWPNVRLILSDNNNELTLDYRAGGTTEMCMCLDKIKYRRAGF